MSSLYFRPTVCPGSSLEMTTTVRAPAESTQLWSPGTLEGEPSSSRASPEFTVRSLVRSDIIRLGEWWHSVSLRKRKTDPQSVEALFVIDLVNLRIFRNQPEEAGPAATDLQKPVRLRQDPPGRQGLHQRAADPHPRKGETAALPIKGFTQRQDRHVRKRIRATRRN